MEEFASGSVPVSVAAKVYEKMLPGFEPASYPGGCQSGKLQGTES